MAAAMILSCRYLLICSATLALLLLRLCSGLSLDTVREFLTREEDTVVFGLIERAKHPRNTPAYDPGYLAGGGHGHDASFAEMFVRESEAVQAKVRPFLISQLWTLACSSSFLLLCVLVRIRTCNAWTLKQYLSSSRFCIFFYALCFACIVKCQRSAMSSGGWEINCRDVDDQKLLSKCFDLSVWKSELDNLINYLGDGLKLLLSKCFD